MNIQNLQFFDKDGYNLNFDWNSNGYWEGSIYLPKVSVGLYANTSIYVLQEIDGTYVFPKASKTGDTITFRWDNLNKFVDEFFMFNFDTDYILKDTSALVYTPNDGPECETLIVNRFDTYDITLDKITSSKALPIHVAFTANERYDATTYNRTLIMYYNKTVIARIKFFAETVEEDERLKIWNANLGYNITPDDTLIFYKSDIKEYKPDYQLLNEKRKELMLEGSNIYPYIGSYRAIINAIKFFGYENLGIIEYWKNINSSDENFGKIYHSSRYSLTKKETLTVGARTIKLPNKDYRKTNQLALVYSINKLTGEVDDWELPYVKEQFTYTIEEALIKLFALRKKLDKEFMPGSSRIIDIIGEANYFGIQALHKTHSSSNIKVSDDAHMHLSVTAYPSNTVYLTNTKYLQHYLTKKNISDFSSATNSKKCEYYRDYYNDAFIEHTYFDNDENIQNSESDTASAKVILRNTTFDDLAFEDTEISFGYKPGTYNTVASGTTTSSASTPYCVSSTGKKNQPGTILPNTDLVCHSGDILIKTGVAFKEFPNIYFIVDSSSSETSLSYNDYITDGSTSLPTASDLKAGTHTICWYAEATEHFTAKRGSVTVRLDTLELGEDKTTIFTFSNMSAYGHNNISWYVKMSDNQLDTDLIKVGVEKYYTKKDDYSFSAKGSINSYNEVLVQLPYVGYYDVTMVIDENGTYGAANYPEQKWIKTIKKCIKVEPYQVEIKGFYYDARELPSSLKYDLSTTDTMYTYIYEKLDDLTEKARAEREGVTLPDNFSMSMTDSSGNITDKGPYYNDNIKYEWYLADNVTYEMSLLMPDVPTSRYIHSGVDIKPYTWILLTYDYSKIAGMKNPTWTITDTVSGVSSTYNGKYFTCLLTEEGEYNISVSVSDNMNNSYTASRNIAVVSDTANHKIYRTFNREYDSMTEQKLLAESKAQIIYEP